MILTQSRPMVEPAPIPDAPIRAEAVDPEQSVLVQAPAGSGKTTLLTQRLLALLQRVQTPERILALTFTRKASQEMRARVMEALEAAAHDTCPPRVNPLTWTLARAARQHLQSLGIDLQQYPTRLRIETIDGFNAWLAAQLPITAGTGGQFVIARDAQRLYRQAAERALAISGNAAFANAVDRSLELNDERWALVRDLVASMLSSRESWLAVLAGHLQAHTDPDELQLRFIHAALEEDLSLLIERHLQSASGELGAERIGALSRLARGAVSRLDSTSPILGNWRNAVPDLRPIAAQVAQWRDLAAWVLTQQGTLRVSVNKNQGFPPGCAAKPEMLDVLAELGRHAAAVQTLRTVRLLPDATYSPQQWERVQAVARTLVLAAAELDTVFRVRGECDFSAVSMAAMRALGTATQPTDLNLLLDYRIEHVLVDEFQDTSNAQLDLFKVMTAGWQRGDGRTFFCVGDPMQSIYGFREAEVRAFLELAQDGLGDVPLRALRLSSNFRAQAPLVEWINATFSQILPARDDRHRGAIAYSPAVARAAAAITADSGVKMLLFDSAAAEAAQVAQEVRKRRDAHPQWRIAILVRNKSHALEIVAALQARYLKFRALEIGRLQDHPVVSDIIALSRALLHLDDRIAWLSVLRSPFVGMHLADLWTLSRGASTLWMALQDDSLHAQLSDDGRQRARRITDTLRQAFSIHDQSSLARWVERVWIALGGPCSGLSETDLASARAAFSRLEQMDASGLLDPTQFESAFDRLFPADEGDQPIEIMTIHKAKGLEFDMVIVPRLEARTRSAARSFLQQHRFSREDRPGFVLAAAAGAGEEEDALFEFLRRADQDSARLEAQRLLYVACTRAKSELWLSAVAGPQDDVDGKEFKPAAASLLGVLWPVVAQDFGRVVVAGRESVPARPTVGLRRVAADWAPPRIEDGVGPIALNAAIDSESSTPPFDWASETARQIGTLVHAQLQLLHCDAGAPARIGAQADYFRRWFAQRGVPAAQIEVATQRVIDSLLAIAEDERGRWILRADVEQEARELGLSGVLEGRIVKIVLDRTFVDQGVRWIIDYKTSQHSGGEREQFLDNEVVRYAQQMRRYARIASRLGPEPIRLGLYFPLMRAWREWPADDEAA